MTATAPLPVATDDPHAARDVALLVDLAELYQRFGLFKNALEVLGLAAWIDPRNADVLRLKAISQFKTGSFAESLETLDQYQMLTGPAGLGEEELSLRISALVLTGRKAEAQTLLAQNNTQQKETQNGRQ